ncbi:MAG: M24 family metallopeptidase [Pirellulaceae bacterium]
MVQPELEPVGCRARRQRLLDVLRDQQLDLAIITQPAHIRWLTGAWFGPMFQPAAAMLADGQVILVAPERKLPGDLAVDEVRGYSAQWHSTLRNDQRQASSAVLVQALADRRAKMTRIGVEGSAFPPYLADVLSGERIDIEAEFYRLRRKKEPDELRMMRHAIDATEAMYAVARETIEPGVRELDLYSRLYATAVDALGEPPTYFGQDFQCNSRGGPPRDRLAEDGELYILDLGAGYRGYFSDNARTIAVNGRPTDEQLKAWGSIEQVFQLVESTVRPGVSCRELFEQVQTLLDACLPWQFNHHLGHGVGLYPHEAPHLNPNWDDTFEVGDVFTAEPGLYHADLRDGMRIEQNYLVTEGGVELLTRFPLEL